MDRKTQIEFLNGNESRVRSYVANWLEDPAVRQALERRPFDDQNDHTPVLEKRRMVG